VSDTDASLRRIIHSAADAKKHPKRPSRNRRGPTTERPERRDGHPTAIVTEVEGSESRPVPLEQSVRAADVGELTVPAEAPPARLLNRELSWLDFDERILALADRTSLPVLDRAKFFAIFSDNLDEFFQVRVGSLKMQLEAGVTSTGSDEVTTGDRLNRINARVRELVAKRDESFAERLMPDLAAAGIRISGWDELDADDRAYLDTLFEEQVFPILTPLAVDPAHPFPYISNLSLNLAVVVRAPGELTRRIARVKVPQSLPRFVMLPDGERFLPLEQLISGRLDALFPGMEIIEHSPFRVTRNTDFDVELRRRRGHGRGRRDRPVAPAPVADRRPVGGQLLDVRGDPWPPDA
jgi:hypothetical protein